MATTTNYGWDTPDDTDLVKDGAAAIRTLGSSIDTTTKNLNPETTLGDIAYRSATSNTNTRLAIGSAGQVLTVAAGVPSWASPAAGSFAGCRLTQSTSNAIANTTWSAITYNTETFDTDGFHSTSTNTSRITIPSGKGGYYQFYGNATIQTTNTTTVINQLFYKNGAEVSQPYIRTGGVGYDSVMISTVLNLSAGDYVEHYMWQNSGGERQIENGFIHFGCIYLGA
jgi:hypothetical protein